MSRPNNIVVPGGQDGSGHAIHLYPDDPAADGSEKARRIGIEYFIDQETLWPSFPSASCWTMPPNTATACRLFNVNNLEQIQAIMEAAEETRSP